MATTRCSIVPRFLVGVVLGVFLAGSGQYAVAAEFAKTTLPLRVSQSGRYLEDSAGQPFLYHADTAWMLFLKLSSEEAAHYLARRQEQGFNVVQVQLTGFLGMRNQAGELPFDEHHDLGHPNARFFEHVDKVITYAEQRNLVLAIAPLWSGCCGEGWAGTDKDGGPKPLNQAGPQQCCEFGRWLGDRYGAFKNVVWILGGDNDPDNAREEIRQLGKGLKESAPRQLITHHAASSHSSTDVWPADEPWLDLVIVYTYFRGFNKAWNKQQPDVYEVCRKEWNEQGIRPFLLGESTYEGEHDAWGNDLQIRKQAYWAVLSGACGQAYGSANWSFPDGWRDRLDLPGATSLEHLRSLMEARQWWSLRPDLGDRLVTDGRGEYARNDLVVAAIGDDESSCLVYIPTRRTITINLPLLKPGKKRFLWFDPRAGSLSSPQEVEGGPAVTFSSPGEGDWVLILENQ